MAPGASAEMLTLFRRAWTVFALRMLGVAGFQVVCNPIRGRTGMRVFCAALIIASLAGAAYAQEDNHVPRYGEKAKEKSQTEINADKAAARAYQNSLKNIPDQAPVDPWG